MGGVLCARVKLLTITIGGCFGGTNGYQIVVADFPDVACSKSDQGLGATRSGYEFHLDGIGRVNINDCTQIATLQPLSREVRVQPMFLPSLHRSPLPLPAASCNRFATACEKQVMGRARVPAA
jgi:hypothetical protein